MGQRNIRIDLGRVFTDPDDDELTLTVMVVRIRDESGVEVEELVALEDVFTGLTYNEASKIITNPLRSGELINRVALSSALGDYMIRITASDNNENTDDIDLNFILRVIANRPPIVVDVRKFQATSFVLLLDFSDIDIKVKFGGNLISDNVEHDIILPADFLSGDAIWIRFDDSANTNVKGVEVVISISDDGETLTFTPTGKIKIIDYDLNGGDQLTTEEIYEIDFDSDTPSAIRDGGVTFTVEEDNVTSDDLHISSVSIDGLKVAKDRLQDNTDTLIDLDNGEAGAIAIELDNIVPLVDFAPLTITPIGGAEGDNIRFVVQIGTTANPKTGEKGVRSVSVDGDTIKTITVVTYSDGATWQQVAFAVNTHSTAKELVSASLAIKFEDFTPLIITSLFGGLSRDNVKFVVKIGTTPNPSTGEKGVKSVSVVDDIITVVTYSDGATWTQVVRATERLELINIRALPETQDHDAEAVVLYESNYEAVVNLADFEPLTVVADEGGSAGNNIRVFVRIGTTANPKIGEKGVESVSVVDDVITVVTYSDGATWQQVANAINRDSKARDLVDVDAAPATAENDAEAVNLYLDRGFEVRLPTVLEFLAANETYIFVKIGTDANPETGEKGVESVSVDGDTITVVTYSDGATWEQVAEAINDDPEAGSWLMLKRLRRRQGVMLRRLLCI